MKIYLIVFLVCSSFLISCGGMHKSRIPFTPQPTMNEKTQITPDTINTKDPPIVEVKEKLVEVKNIPVDPHVYFVIIGSFRNLNNAKNYQEQIISDGFTSVLLQNEAGLYRVSVKSTDDISLARTEIRRIRSQFKKYEDTWLLISIK